MRWVDALFDEGWRASAAGPVAWGGPRRCGGHDTAPGAADPQTDADDDDGDGGGVTHRRLLVVSVLGMMDDVAIFIAMLLAGTFTWLELIIGVFFGASSVLCFCLFMTCFTPIVRIIQSIPLFVIIGSFSIYTLVEAITFTPEPAAAAANATARRLLGVADDDDSEPAAAAADAPGGGSRHGAAVYLYALGLSVSSSTDNFAVGASLGVAGLTLRTRFNLIIAAANAAGAYVAATGGQLIGRFADGAGAWLAAAVFAHLSVQEGASLARGEAASPLLRLAEQAAAAQLAVPMTLNNLAGGIAGGVVGIGPTLAGGSAFVASFVMMAVGYVLGKCVGGALDGRLDVRLLSCAIFAFLCVSQVEDKLRAFWAAHVQVWWRRHGTSATVLAVAAVGALVAAG